MASEGLAREAAWTRLRELVRRLLRVMEDGGVFAGQAAEHTRYCFPPALFGLDVLIDRDGRPWLLECQRNPAMTGNPLTNRINAGLFAAAFRMSVFCLLDDLDDDPAPLADEARRAVVKRLGGWLAYFRWSRCTDHRRPRASSRHPQGGYAGTKGVTLAGHHLIGGAGSRVEYLRRRASVLLALW